MENDIKAVELIVKTIAQTAIDNEQYFSELDAVVGDGDFGYSLARGFEQVISDWDTFDRTNVGTFLKKIGVVITSKIGGTSGPIWGTAFLRAGTTAGNKDRLSASDVIAMLRAAIEGIKQRGQTDVGDKTLLDAFVPAVDRLEHALNEGDRGAAALQQAAMTARTQAEETRNLIAKRGRASYAGDRSVGTLDAGAVAVAVLFEQVSRAWEQANPSIHQQVNTEGALK